MWYDDVNFIKKEPNKVLLKDLANIFGHGDFRYKFELYDSETMNELKGPECAYIDSEVVGIRLFKIARELINSSYTYSDSKCYIPKWDVTLILVVMIKV